MPGYDQREIQEYPGRRGGCAHQAKEGMRECKTASALSMKLYAGGEFPESYYAQCVAYLAVTGWERWDKPAQGGGHPQDFQPDTGRIQKNNDWLDGFLAEQEGKGGGEP